MMKLSADLTRKTKNSYISSNPHADGALLLLLVLLVS